MTDSPIQRCDEASKKADNEKRETKTTVILHSDRGCQFTSDEYQRFLQGHNLICSMGAVGSCADNAAAESFFGVLAEANISSPVSNPS